MIQSIVICIAVIVTVPVLSSTNADEDTLNSLPHVIRQPSSPLVRVLNVSSTAGLQEEAIANASSTLSNTSLTDIENDNITHSLQMRYRERKKQERIIVIQAQILHRLRMDRQPNISNPIFSEDEQKKIAMILERMHHINNNHAQQMDAQPGIVDPLLAMRRMQSFYPSCNLPNSTDRSLFESSSTFRIYYNLPFNRHLSAEISVVQAKLRLFKLTAANGINVNVYQYLKPVRLNKKEKKRLVDSRTLSLDQQGWVEFNVIGSLNYWLHHSNKNFGFGIEVEDAFGNKLNPNLYFQNMNCSTEPQILIFFSPPTAQESPFPNILELDPEMGENESSLFDNETYPTLDLQTAEMPREFSEFEALTDRFNERIIRKRSSRRDEKTLCRSEKVYVSFADLGLDEFIVFPQGVLWTFCDGKCEGEAKSNEASPSYYPTWLQRLLRLNKNHSNSSCIVISRESLPIVMYDGDRQMFETVIEDIVPTSCGCKAT
ncbi:bone morphogenetic protein 7-like [Uloborus diversus]|uniref:bone morphogenetic protein 7-like n=1 Tax=Uloborus diversus TaxID=327109 RepID=UPI00240A3F32|nr:bone morphogenetic protein 7-like [Uloborus diversus]